MKLYWNRETWKWEENPPVYGGKSAQVMSDISEFKSPIDGSIISSRSGLKEHEKIHGVRQIGNDWGGTSDKSPQPDWFKYND